MTARRICSVMAMVVTASVIVGFGFAYSKIQKHEQLSRELDSWKKNLVAERNREFREVAK